MLTALLPLLAASATPSAQWVEREFSDAPATEVAAMEEFINGTCAPKGLDGIQVFAIQAGHNSPPHIHIYCRTDRKAKARYKVELRTFGKAAFGSAVGEMLPQPDVRMTNFYFGAPGEPDGLMFIRKLGKK